MLFHHTLIGRESWSAVFQSKEAFTPLAAEIMAQNYLPFSPLTNVTPGTNAVFKSGGYILKIYAPEQTGFNGPAEYLAEAGAIEHAAAVGVPAPVVYASGYMDDRYRFYFVVMEHLAGEEIGTLLSDFSKKQKQQLADEMKAILKKFHTQPKKPLPVRAAAPKIRPGPVGEMFAPSLIREMDSRANAVLKEPFVPTHSDLTGENLLVLPTGTFRIIDWADSRMAPACNELPPLVFELFGADSFLTQIFFAGSDYAVKDLIDGLCIHAFRLEILANWVKKASVNLADITDLAILQSQLEKTLFV